MARPKVVIDFNKVEELASVGCTVEEIATHLNVSKTTLYKRKEFLESYERGLTNCKLSVRQALVKKGVVLGDVKALIFLAKNLLNYTDKMPEENLKQIEIKNKEAELKLKEKQLNSDGDSDDEIIVGLESDTDGS